MYRPCVLYSDDTVHNSTDITEDLSKCLIKEAENVQPEADPVPMTRVPIQVPQRVQGEPNFSFSFNFAPRLFLLFYLALVRLLVLSSQS